MRSLLAGSRARSSLAPAAHIGRAAVGPRCLRSRLTSPHRSPLVVALAAARRSPSVARRLCHLDARVNCRSLAVLPRLYSPSHGLRPRLAGFVPALTTARRHRCPRSQGREVASCAPHGRGSGDMVFMQHGGALEEERRRQGLGPHDVRRQPRGCARLEWSKRARPWGAAARRRGALAHGRFQRRGHARGAHGAGEKMHGGGEEAARLTFWVRFPSLIQQNLDYSLLFYPI